ncbi:hypothetical protein MTO96_018997 [Rhipicephalus appendiculatus]
MEPEGCPRKSSTSSPLAPRSSTPELQPTEGHRKVSLASAQPRSPPAQEPAVTTVASPSTLSHRKRKRARIRKLLRSPSAAPSTPAVMSTNTDTTASASGTNKAAIEAALANRQPARVRTPDHADASTVAAKASAGLARHQGMEELQAIGQNRQRRTPLRETTNTLGHTMSPAVSGYLRLRTPSPSCPGTPPSTGVKGGPAPPDGQPGPDLCRAAARTVDAQLARPRVARAADQLAGDDRVPVRAAARRRQRICREH